MRNSLDIFSNRRSLFDLATEMERAFSLGPARENWAPTFKPACDIHENEDFYLASFDLPGINKEDIKIEVVDQRLVVTGERTRRVSENGKNGQFFERQFGRFERVFEMPPSADLDKVEAHYENGVLQLMIPKTVATKPKAVEIKTGTNKSFLDRFLGSHAAEKQNSKSDTEKYT